MDKYEWTRISDPDGAQQGLFKASKPVYEQLFQPQHRERFSDFRKYILDAEKNRRRRKQDRPIDGYWVGSIDSDVRGMALVTGYENHRLGFISYFGVLQPNTQQGKMLAGKGFETINNEFSKGGIEAILTEVEKISLAYLDDRKKVENRDPWLEMRWHFLKSVQKRGTRKISFIDYLQPILEVERIGAGEEMSDLHLMVRDTSTKQRDDKDRYSRDRDTVKRYVEFVYNVLYRDGFGVSDSADIEKAEKYLSQLSQRVLNDLPGDLERVPLGEVALEPLGIHAMISYVIEDGTQLKELLRRYLTDMGVHVTDWGRDSHSRVGDPLKATLGHMVHKSDVVIALLTPGFLTSKGMQSELESSSMMGKQVLPLLDGECDQGARKRIVSLLEKAVGGVTVYETFYRRNFDEAVYALCETIRKLSSKEHR